MNKNLLVATWVALASVLLSGQTVAENAAISNMMSALEKPQPHVLFRHPDVKNESQASISNDLVYQGGNSPVMTGNVTLYAIYWSPSKLQDGTAASIPTKYQQFQNQFLKDLSNANGLSSIVSQYYQVIKGTTTYVSGKLFFGGFFVDTSNYPTTSCLGSASANCINDSDLQTELEKVIAANKWPVNNNTMFLVYMAKGEDLCDGTGNCESTTFCAYHNFIPASQTSSAIIYSALPYTGINGCGIGIFPQKYPDAEAVANAATHEIYESITDPLVAVNPAWNSADGSEIGDLCNGKVITKNFTWNKGTANHMWNGRFYALQPEYDNHLHACADLGS